MQSALVMVVHLLEGDYEPDTPLALMSKLFMFHGACKLEEAKRKQGGDE